MFHPAVSYHRQKTYGVSEQVELDSILEIILVKDEWRHVAIAPGGNFSLPTDCFEVSYGNEESFRKKHVGKYEDDEILFVGAISPPPEFPELQVPAPGSKHSNPNGCLKSFEVLVDPLKKFKWRKLSIDAQANEVLFPPYVFMIHPMRNRTNKKNLRVGKLSDGTVGSILRASDKYIFYSNNGEPQDINDSMEILCTN